MGDDKAYKSYPEDWVALPQSPTDVGVGCDVTTIAFSIPHESGCGGDEL